MHLAKVIPFAAATFVIGGMASIGLPGFSGFVAELQVLIGTWRAFPLFALLAGLGIVIGIAYTWRAMQKAFFGTMDQDAPATSHPLSAITLPERIGAVILIAASLVIGLYPQLLLRLIVPALHSSMFDGLWIGGGR
jgi:NADH-quinone oxidoreductase subunit M